MQGEYQVSGLRCQVSAIRKAYRLINPTPDTRYLTPGTQHPIPDTRP